MDKIKSRLYEAGYFLYWLVSRFLNEVLSLVGGFNKPRVMLQIITIFLVYQIFFNPAWQIYGLNMLRITAIIWLVVWVWKQKVDGRWKYKMREKYRIQGK